MPQKTFDDKSTSVQVMAWCCQATSITWANVDLYICCHIAWLGLNEINATSYFSADFVTLIILANIELVYF